MTEEIINGIDVANCGYFCETDKECSICGMGTSGEDTFCRDCKDNSNCYYKQLKRLEQENKELKEKITSLESEIRQKKMTIMMNNDHYLTVDENNRKYRSVLEEIREIAKFNQFYNPEDLLINGDIGQIQNLKMTEIYNRIIEVLND